eukprot:GEZU01015678.1.p1 GENE.GEZU01015678.1~~GEZU01015678.1.p1  ORF type:complete len:127 (+),score=30.48 GEZU01015678.1:47-427(+)
MRIIVLVLTLTALLVLISVLIQTHLGSAEATKDLLSYLRQIDKDAQQQQQQQREKFTAYKNADNAVESEARRIVDDELLRMKSTRTPLRDRSTDTLVVELKEPNEKLAQEIADRNGLVNLGSLPGN